MKNVIFKWYILCHDSHLSIIKYYNISEGYNKIYPNSNITLSKISIKYSILIQQITIKITTLFEIYVLWNDLNDLITTYYTISSSNKKNYSIDIYTI